MYTNQAHSCEIFESVRAFCTVRKCEEESMNSNVVGDILRSVEVGGGLGEVLATCKPSVAARMHIILRRGMIIEDANTTFYRLV
jgi:hypothetical protein